MKKIIFVYAGLLVFGLSDANAQWVTSGSPTSTNLYSNGKAGIGMTAAPAERLQVNSGVLRITGSNSSSYSPSSISAGAVLLGNNGNTNSWAQSYGSSNSSFTPLLLNPRGGNVGIGTISPLANLTVDGSGIISTSLTVAAGTLALTNVAAQVTGQAVFTDKIGVNIVPVPGIEDEEDYFSLLNIQGGDLKIIETNDYSKNPDGNSADLYLTDKTGATFNIFQGYNVSFMSMSNEMRVGDMWDSQSSLSFFPDGKLTIGSDKANVSLNRPAGYKLYVKEGILTEKLKVAFSTDAVKWADYVFDESYKLRSLEQVEKFIKAHKHLPEVPSACEVYSEGIDVAQMDATLLKKIEELTLYAIHVRKKNLELAAEFKSIKGN